LKFYKRKLVLIVSKFELIDGTVSELVVRQDEHDFVFNATDKTSGAVAATGLAIGGLAGAATGAVLSSSETAEQVDYFLCKVGEHSVRGRFGKVTFVDGDIVQIAVQRENNNLQAYAVVRCSVQLLETRNGKEPYLMDKLTLAGMNSVIYCPVRRRMDLETASHSASA
jgi:hypothetical protein